MSREEPSDVDPVSADGIRYEAVHWGKAIDLGQNGGYVRAVDARTEQELWTQKVYDIDYTRDMEPDRLDVFITRLVLSDDARTLTIDDENGRTWVLDLVTRTVRPGA